MEAVPQYEKKPRTREQLEDEVGRLRLKLRQRRLALKQLHRAHVATLHELRSMRVTHILLIGEREAMRDEVIDAVTIEDEKIGGTD